MRLIILCLLVVGFASAQTAQSVAEFFSQLSSIGEGTPVPSYDELLRVVDHIDRDEPGRLRAALPDALRALTSRRLPVARYAALALTAIARRPDSATLVSPFLEGLGTTLGGPGDQRVKAALIEVIVGLRPAPPPEATAILISYLNAERDPTLQVAAVYGLTRVAPGDARVVEAIVQVARGPLGANDKAGLLRQLANPKLDDPRLAKVILDALSDPEERVKIEAIQAIRRNGNSAVLSQARAKLQQLGDDPAQTAAVRQRAAELLLNVEEAPLPVDPRWRQK
jgi:hypothetical protein